MLPARILGRVMDMNFNERDRLNKVFVKSYIKEVMLFLGEKICSGTFSASNIYIFIIDESFILSLP